MHTERRKKKSEKVDLVTTNYTNKFIQSSETPPKRTSNLS